MTVNKFAVALVSAAVVAASVVGATTLIGPTMSTYTGPSRVPCGTTIDHKTITGNIEIGGSNGNRGIYGHNGETAARAAACVILTNDVIDMVNPGNGEKGVDNGYLNYRTCTAGTTCAGGFVGGSTLYMADTTIIVHPYSGASSGGYTYGCGSANVHAWRITISGGPQGCTTEGYDEIYDSNLSADHSSGGSHMDAIITNGNGGAPMVFDGNVLTCTDSLGGFNTTSSAGCSAPVGMFADNTAISNVTISNNLIHGTSGGHWCMYTGASQPGKPNPTGTNIAVVNNHFDAIQCKHSATYLGPVGDWAPNAGNVFCGNSFTDGITSGFGMPTSTAGACPAAEPTPVLPGTTTTTGAPTTSSSTSTTRATTTTVTVPVTTTTRPPVTTTTVAPPPTTTTVPAPPPTFQIGLTCNEGAPHNCKVTS